jgi:pyridinium-3,5-bisthiocarboxylic acid mononucleotide nickel chelatase
MLTYIDCGSGVAGDMLLGACIGLGLSVRDLERVLRPVLKTDGWHLRAIKTERRHWPAWSFNVEGDRPFGPLAKMVQRVRSAPLPLPVKAHALSIFSRLQKAEAQAHGKPGEFDPEGLGLMDTLVDVVGNSWAFWKLGLIDPIASPINTGRIAPATAAMLRSSKVPVFSKGAENELATPTGVAILLQFVRAFRGMPDMQLKASGFGAGENDPVGRPNVVGIYRGSADQNQEVISVLETVIDDMDPRLYPHVMEILLAQGALDVWWTSIGMKKGRPGISLTTLCRPELEQQLRDIIFRETTTLGIRSHQVSRQILPRHSSGARKIAWLPDGTRRAKGEYERVRQISKRRAKPLVKLLK